MGRSYGPIKFTTYLFTLRFLAEFLQILKLVDPNFGAFGLTLLVRKNITTHSSVLAERFRTGP